MYYLGIDLGTSGVKGVLFDKSGNIIDSYLVEYDIISIKDGYAEEDPIIWFNSTIDVLKYFGKKKYGIKGIGISGQMHGLVILDKNNKPLRNSIIWCDNRTDFEKELIEKELGFDECKRISGNIPMSAFTLSKLLWVKNNELDIYNKIDKIMLPKDYISFMLTGDFLSEYSDLSGTQLLDINKKDYSVEILNKYNIDKNKLPKIINSYDIRGYIKKDIEQIIGLNNIYVVGGAADQAASAIGSGIINSNAISISLGSSGVIFNPCDDLKIYPNGELQTFIAGDNKYYNMGCTNGFGTSLKWLRDQQYNMKYDEMTSLARKIDCGSNNLYFLPYLMGERTPILDNDAKGVYFGIKNTTTKGHMIRALMEGVGYSIKDSYNMLDKKIDYAIVSGGGAKSKLYKEIIASMLNLELKETQSETGALGAAILAMVGGGEYKNIGDAIKEIVKYDNTTKPINEWASIYDKGYKIYKEIYNSTKHIFKEIK